MITLYGMKCEQGYLRKVESGCQCVNLEKATVVKESGLDGLEALAESAKQAGYKNIRIIEMLLTEGKCIKTF
ncbi:hypothetical protein NVS47_09410 [Dehalobacterium formicoaceticum]|uniref:Uncharacterized protein n=1 Tax=Dehalobacterium formicoaceticum TaxID=51515 RepID=A0ABT1Y593_9FIRM|nr:hypothetical protein [Dehalobacterium formicoaceticum]MCR6545723.1 hypothetical protein [Dehalobacterium formicoaceticum]